MTRAVLSIRFEVGGCAGVAFVREQSERPKTTFSRGLILLGVIESTAREYKLVFY